VANGHRSRRVSAKNSIGRFVDMDRQADHLDLVTTHVTTPSPHSLVANEYVRVFLAPLTKYVPPSHDNIVKLLQEFLTPLINCARKMFQAAKKRMGQLPFMQLVTYMWNEKHANKSYASVVVRDADLAHFQLKGV